ncbi:hypothetical protein [Asticcacaulis sp. AC402]|uniref:hypothetical protein n=1 Tax=Asticcacaulis sp. AC402 TaxID=1282361 RepID=UPI0012DCDB57|nr:hypothetical protein [Asticcacaulis sp. AC402]
MTKQKLRARCRFYLKPSRSSDGPVDYTQISSLKSQAQVASQVGVALDYDRSIVIARTLEIQNSPALVINGRYTGSGVPAPEGMGPRSSTVLKP